MFKKFMTFAVGIALAGSLGAAAAQAEFKLDSRYTDSDGDLLSLIHISSPRDQRGSRMPSSA